MKILITGINGYLGTLITTELRQNGHSVQGLDRSVSQGPVEKLAEHINGNDAIINLAGSNILKRWTSSAKDKIYSSRINTTKNLVTAIRLLDKKERPGLFISASAIGIYKAGDVHDETSTNFDQSFLGKVVKDWEAELNDLPKEIRTVIFRISPVLGKDSKMIKNLKLPFMLGLGGKIASGKQAFPFIHEKDLVRAFSKAIEENWQGIFNLSAPKQISNLDFTRTFANIIHRPAVIPVPVFALRLIYGEAATMLVDSPQVLPKALSEQNFHFEFPSIKKTLTEILG